MQARLSAANAVAPDLIATASLTVETHGEGFCEITSWSLSGSGSDVP
jgi:hypothetical protein